MLEMLLNFNVFVCFSFFCGLNGFQEAAAESYECFFITCDEEDCLYPTIQQAGSYISTCTTTEDQVCLVEKQYFLGGNLQMSAKCGPDCNAEPTTTEKLGIFRRRKRSARPETKCCYSDRCNHDSPCGSLTCSAGVSVASRTFHVTVLLVSLALVQ